MQQSLNDVPKAQSNGSVMDKRINIASGEDVMEDMMSRTIWDWGLNDLIEELEECTS